MSHERRETHLGRHFLLVGLDEKVTWDNGRIVFLPPGRDSLCIFDVATHPEEPELVARMSLPNSVFGPPTNLAVTPDQRMALVADPMAWIEQDTQWKPIPGDGVYVIDLDVEPPAILERIQVGRQPSGLAINPQGTLALIACRADRCISVLSIGSTGVSFIDHVDMGAEVTAVSFSADGSRAFAVKTDTHRLGVLHIDGNCVRHDATEDITTGLVPYNVAASPDGRLVLTVDMGSPTASDGHADSVSVIDVKAVPPRVIDKIMVEDGPEGIAISPDGRYAAVAIVQGSNNPEQTWFHHPVGQVILLRLDGDRVERAGSLPVGALPEGLAFSPDSRYLYVGNFLDADLWVLEIRDGALVDTGRRIALPGHPASMRTQST